MSNDLNRCTFIGRLGKDAEQKTLKNGKIMTTFSLAVGESWIDFSGEKVKKTEWINVVCYGKLAEICGKYLGKGFQVYIEGRFNTNKYQGKDGTEKTSVQIVINSMQMLGGAKMPKSESQSEIEVESETNGFDDCDIPF
jgi:single-strand DNA-binding protein